MQQRIIRRPLDYLIELRSLVQSQGHPIDDDIEHGPPLALVYEPVLDREFPISLLVDQGRLDHGAILRDGLRAEDGWPLGQQPQH
jgi:hypothetical protein